MINTAARYCCTELYQHVVRELVVVVRWLVFGVLVCCDMVVLLLVVVLVVVSLLLMLVSLR